MMLTDEPRLPIADIIRDLERPFPPQAIKQREGGGNRKYDYVETQTVVRRLNEATANHWDYRITRLEWHGDLLIATGELTIPGLGTRSGTGVQKVSERGGEDLIKGAASDCLKNCARLFGVALDLYGPDYESGETATPPTRHDDRIHLARTRGSRHDPPEPDEPDPDEYAAWLAQREAQKQPAQPKLDLLSDTERETLETYAASLNIDKITLNEQAKKMFDNAVAFISKEQGRLLYRWVADQDLSKVGADVP